MGIDPTHIIVVKKLEGYLMDAGRIGFSLNTPIPAEYVPDEDGETCYKVMDPAYFGDTENHWNIHPDDIKVLCSILVLEE